MQFAEASPSKYRPRRAPRGWRTLLMLAAAVGVVAAVQPWIEVRFPRLFGEEFGPPAWRSTAGFTCLITCALVFVITLAESNTRSSREAVRPACMLLAAVMALAMLAHALQGPGMLRGVSAAWTAAFYVGGSAAAALLIACAARVRRA